jgi:hypothetical protein
MTLYLLTQTGSVDWEDDRAVLVRASTPEEARRIAQDSAGYGQHWGASSASCEIIDPDGPAEIIITDNVGM